MLKKGKSNNTTCHFKMLTFFFRRTQLLIVYFLTKVVRYCDAVPTPRKQI